MGGRGRGGNILGRYGDGGRVSDVLGYLVWKQFRGGRKGTGKIMVSRYYMPYWNAGSYFWRVQSSLTPTMILKQQYSLENAMKTFKHLHWLLCMYFSKLRGSWIFN